MLIRLILYLIIGINSDLEELVNNFLEVWECVREDILMFCKFVIFKLFFFYKYSI